MATVPLAQFLNRAYISHEHQRRLCARNERRRVMDILTGHLRNPSIHRNGCVKTVFIFTDYPSLMILDELCETFTVVNAIYSSQGYGVSTECDREGFTITLDWRSL